MKKSMFILLLTWLILMVSCQAEQQEMPHETESAIQAGSGTSDASDESDSQVSTDGAGSGSVDRPGGGFAGVFDDFSSESTSGTETQESECDSEAEADAEGEAVTDTDTNSDKEPATEPITESITESQSDDFSFTFPKDEF